MMNSEQLLNTAAYINTEFSDYYHAIVENGGIVVSDLNGNHVKSFITWHSACEFCGV